MIIHAHDNRFRAIEERLTRLEKQVQYLASKEDIQSLKTLIAEKQSEMLKWQVGIVAAALIAFVGIVFKALSA